MQISSAMRFSLIQPLIVRHDSKHSQHEARLATEQFRRVFELDPDSIPGHNGMLGIRLLQATDEWEKLVALISPNPSPEQKPRREKILQSSRSRAYMQYALKMNLRQPDRPAHGWPSRTLPSATKIKLSNGWKICMSSTVFDSPREGGSLLRSFAPGPTLRGFAAPHGPPPVALLYKLLRVAFECAYSGLWPVSTDYSRLWGRWT